MSAGCSFDPERTTDSEPGSVVIEREAFVWSTITRAVDILVLSDPSTRKVRDQRGKRAAHITLERLIDDSLPGRRPISTTAATRR